MGADTGGADYSLRILWSLARWVEDTKGDAAFAHFADVASLRTADFDASTRWITAVQMEALLAEGRRLAGTEEAFRLALTHRFKESYGAFKNMVWAVSLERMAAISVTMANKVLMRTSHKETIYAGPGRFAFRYTTVHDESADMCLSRRMAWEQVPTLHGVPAARIVEPKCLARGDDCCEYHLTWVDNRALTSVLGGLAVGVGAAVVAHHFDPSAVAGAALVLFGAGAGYAADLRRVVRGSVAQATIASAELRKLGETEAETRSEIVALQQRQREWAARVEQDRAETVARILGELDGVEKSRVTSLKGFSHDLRNPLFVVRANTRLLRETITEGEEAEILDDMTGATDQIESMLGRLMDLVTADAGVTKLASEELLVAPLADMLKRRLRALVHGRNIDVSVVANANAPRSVVVDRLVFDRVVDNLLTNAAKYTERGAIKIVLRGSRADEAPDGLMIEIADTGRGIPKSKIAEILRPRATGIPRAKDSWGVGLSSAIRLLGQIGGGLEVSSEVDRGSTFRARFPARPPATSRVDEDLDGLIASVVKVRTASSGAA